MFQVKANLIYKTLYTCNYLQLAMNGVQLNALFSLMHLNFQTLIFQISCLSENISQCPRLKVLRLEENCLNISAFTPKILKESKIALFAVEGNVFDMKAFHNLEGYDEVGIGF